MWKFLMLFLSPLRFGVVDDAPAGEGPEAPEAPESTAEPAPAPAPAGEPPAPEPAKKEALFDTLKAALGSGDAPPKPDAAKPVDQAKPADKPKPEDKYAPPPDLGPKGQTRFKELVSEIKTKDEAITQLTERAKVTDGFLEAAKSVGAGPQEFQQFFEFMGALQSNPKMAIQYLEGQIAAIAKQHGLAAGGNEGDLLSRHRDLADDVESYKISRERALELAEQRERDTRRTEQDRQAQQSREKEAADRQVEDKAIAEVSAWLKSATANDIDWVRKKDIFFEQLPAVLDGVPPERWGQKVQALYNGLSKLSPPAPQPKPGSPAPLRASTGSGVAPANSMFDGIKAGLARMAGGG